MITFKLSLSYPRPKSPTLKTCDPSFTYINMLSGLISRWAIFKSCKALIPKATSLIIFNANNVSSSPPFS